ncbi:polyisoprenoid-binding protein [Raineyella fluvialis]|uniref:Polyisoprenoid-binding protein n=2 Tax=Raineyella fluvialis TaxID=2662261 RepID=A0A5Q2FF38_9ACTN|nr:YceI family protein [Raineyella fluvialis]QGF25021.1 polyisoprenoid-binding protein [Raineyella fluvialis]
MSFFNKAKRAADQTPAPVAAVSTSGPLFQLDGTYNLDPSHTQIGFVARHAMVTKVRGRFAEFSGSASTKAGLVDPKIEVTVQVPSISTNDEGRDGHLKSADFFDVEQFPTITFSSTDVTAVADDTLRVAGELTIKDVTKPVTIDFEYAGAALDPFGNQRVGLEGSTVVDRKEFGLTWNAALETGGVLVSDKITLEFEISAIKAA